MSQFADRVFETTATSGTGTLTLAGAVSGRRAFSDAFSVSDSVAYAISQDGVGWEVGLGTLSSVSPDLLTRDTVLASTNSGLKVNFAAGGSVKNVFNPAPAALFGGLFIDGAGPTVRYDFDKGADIASAATPDIAAATGNSVDLSGSVTITGFATAKAGIERTTRTLATPTFQHSAALILPGGRDIVAAAGDVQKWLSLGGGNWLCTSYQRAVEPPEGPYSPTRAPSTISNNTTDPTNDIDFAPAKFRDDADTGNLVVTAAIAKGIDTTWSAGGVPAVSTGGRSSSVALAVSTWYHCFVGKVSGVVEAGFDTSLTGANLAADHGFTNLRRVGSVYRNGAGVIAPFLQYEDNFRWVTAVRDVNATIAGTYSTQTISTPLGIVTRAFGSVSATAGQSLRVRSINTTDPQAVVDTPGNAAGAGTATRTAGTFEEFTDTSSQLQLSQSGSGNAKLDTHGWIDPRGRHG